MSEQGERRAERHLVAAGTGVRDASEPKRRPPSLNLAPTCRTPDLVARAHRAVWYRDAARWLEMGLP